MGKMSSVVQTILQGDPALLLSCFAGPPRVNSQTEGVVEGHDAVVKWVADTHKWFSELEGRWEGGLDIDGERFIHETSLSIKTKDGEVDLPFVVVAELDGDSFKEIRTYHSTWPYTGGHVFRKPPVEQGDLSKVPKVFSDYIDRLATKDVDLILESFSAEGYVREPSGNRYKYQGAKQRDDFYRGHIGEAPAARFDLKTCTNGKDVTAVEYAFAYGDAELVGGICIMEHHDGKIDAVRITDDVGA